MVLISGSPRADAPARPVSLVILPSLLIELPNFLVLQPSSNALF